MSLKIFTKLQLTIKNIGSNNTLSSYLPQPSIWIMDDIEHLHKYVLLNLDGLSKVN